MTQPTLLCDLDNVLRTFDRSGNAFREIEIKHDLPESAMLSAIFEPSLSALAVTGAISHTAWVERIKRSLSDTYTAEAANELIDVWVHDRGELLDTTVEAVSELREAGWSVALVTNATDRLDEDLRQLGLRSLLDYVVNSSVIGVAKPEAPYYQHALRITGASAETCLFVDDRPENVATAISLGMSGVVFAEATDIRRAASAMAND